MDCASFVVDHCLRNTLHVLALTGRAVVTNFVQRDKNCPFTTPPRLSARTHARPCQAMSGARPYDEEEAHDSDEEEETDDSATDESDSFDDEQSWCATRSSTRVPFSQNAVCLTCSASACPGSLGFVRFVGTSSSAQWTKIIYATTSTCRVSQHRHVECVRKHTRLCPCGRELQRRRQLSWVLKGLYHLCCSPTPRRLSSDRASLPATPSMYLPCPRSRCRPGTTTTR